MNAPEAVQGMFWSLPNFPLQTFSLEVCLQIQRHPRRSQPSTAHLIAMVGTPTSDVTCFGDPCQSQLLHASLSSKTGRSSFCRVCRFKSSPRKSFRIFFLISATDSAESRIRRKCVRAKCHDAKSDGTTIDVAMKEIERQKRE